MALQHRSYSESLVIEAPWGGRFVPLSGVTVWNEDGWNLGDRVRVEVRVTRIDKGDPGPAVVGPYSPIPEAGDETLPANYLARSG